MPTYDYHCTLCTYVEEIVQKITDDSLTCCPQCGKESLQRGLGGGLGVVFKGSGFYCTDYNRPSKEKPEKPVGCQHNQCGCFSKNSSPPS